MTTVAIVRLLVRNALPLLGVLLVGCLLYRTSIFNPALPESQLITLGLTGAVLLALGVNIKRWNFLIAVPLLLAADALLMGPGGITTLGARWLYLAATALAVVIYLARYEQLSAGLPLVSTLMLSSLTALTFLAAAFILGLFIASHSFDSDLLWAISRGFLVGAGLGLGVDLQKKYL